MARGGGGCCANNLRHLQPSWLSVSGVVAWQPVERHVWLLIKILNENATAEMVTGSVRRSAALRCHGDSGLDLNMGSRCAGAMVMGMGLGEFTARRDRTARSVCSGVMCVCECVCVGL